MLTAYAVIVVVFAVAGLARFYFWYDDLFQVSFSVKWRDLWVGLYVGRGERAIYVCPAPCLCMRVAY